MSADDLHDTFTAPAAARGQTSGSPDAQTTARIARPPATRGERSNRRASSEPARRGALRARLRGIPRAAWICALIAIVNAVSWSVISPPFQLPDEPSHFAYVQHIAETGHLPSSNGNTFPPAEQAALAYLLYSQVRFSQENHTIRTAQEQRQLEAALALPLARDQPGDASVAASEPPLYYTLETIPYLLGSSGTLLDSLALMRLFSALFGGLTALFAFLFLREVLPGARWAWTVGGLGVALAPMLAIMSGAVNPDAMLFAVSTALFYCFARAFRRGLSRRLAIAIGALIAIGCLTKLIFLGLVPGALLGLLALSVREARVAGRAAYRSLALALALVAVPACAYVLRNALSDHITQHVLSSGLSFSGGHHRSLLGAFVYIWQLYLPRLPGMQPTFHGISGDQIWFEQLVGKYGWLDTTFPAWVVKVALIPVGIVTVLFLRGLAFGRRALRARCLELAVYAVMGLGVLLVIGADEYVNRIPNQYLQLRYLMPMIALFGVTLALAARGAGRRWGPIAGVFIVLLVLAHDLVSQLLVIARYYG
jgi:Predicted membrane protein (DUF2142)